MFGRVDEAVEDEIPDGDVEEAEADDRETHDSSGTERDLEAFVQALARALGGAAGGGGGGLHAHETAEAGEEAAGQKRDRDEGVLELQEGQDGEDHEEHGEDDADAGILLAQIGHRAVAHIAGDLLHAFVAAGSAFHEDVAERSGQERDNGADRGDPPDAADAVNGIRPGHKNLRNCSGRLKKCSFKIHRKVCIFKYKTAFSGGGRQEKKEGKDWTRQGRGQDCAESPERDRAHFQAKSSPR